MSIARSQNTPPSNFNVSLYVVTGVLRNASFIIIHVKHRLLLASCILSDHERYVTLREYFYHGDSCMCPKLADRVSSSTVTVFMLSPPGLPGPDSVIAIYLTVTDWHKTIFLYICLRQIIFSCNVFKRSYNLEHPVCPASDLDLVSFVKKNIFFWHFWGMIFVF